jgi:tetratricopeptide (TPR) repeat protein
MRAPKITISLILLLFIPVLAAPAQNVDSLIIKGNKSYNEARYEKAIESYLDVINEGYESSELHYNIGNSYFKLNKIPEAILYYEKAKKLDPVNEDIDFNLSLANSRTIDKIDAIPELFYVKWWNNLKNLTDLDGWAWIGTGAFIFFWLLILFFTFSKRVAIRKISFWTGIVVIIITVLSFILAGQSYREITLEKEAIIFTPTLTVKSSPNENSVDLFVIHEGTKVRITDQVEGWSEVVIANGSKGWVKDDTYRII